MLTVLISTTSSLCMLTICRVIYAYSQGNTVIDIYLRINTMTAKLI